MGRQLVGTVRRTPVLAVASLGPDGTAMTATGRLIYLRTRTTRQGRAWATAILSTSDGRMPLSVFPAAYAEHHGRFHTGQRVTVNGRVDRRGSGAARLIAFAASTITPLAR